MSNSEYDPNETEAETAARHEERRKQLAEAEAAGDRATSEDILRRTSREAKARRGLVA